MTSHYNDSTLTRWLAVSQRDPAANSSFLYGVNSTRIFCRPTCPGRLARRSNIVFFDSKDQAFEAGYRPCKRCQPCTLAWNKESQGRTLVNKAREMILAAVETGTPWTVNGVAQGLGITGAHLHRLFKKHFDVTPRLFAASFNKGIQDMGIPDMCCDEGVQTDSGRAIAEDTPFLGFSSNLGFGSELDVDFVGVEPLVYDGYLSAGQLTGHNPLPISDFDLETFLDLSSIMYK